MTGAAITFEGLGKSFPKAGGQVTALADITLSVPEGSITGIIGRSGAGKSTLLRMVNGLERPTTGRVTVSGRDVGTATGSALRAIRRDVGMIFQHFNLLASRNVADNVAFPLRLADQPRDAIARRVADLLDRVGLSAHAQHYPAQLSGGQKQRVGIARALASAPRVLLCDEATSALDPQTTASVLDLLARINREDGLTVVLITHEMDVVRRVCDRVAVLEDGHLVETGPVAEIFLHPGHATTRRFVHEREPAPAAAIDSAGADDAARVRVTWRGADSQAAALGRIARETGVDFALLGGQIDRIKDLPYAQLTLAVHGAGREAALAALRESGARVEALD